MKNKCAALCGLIALLASPELSRLLIGPAWDCNNAGFTGGAHESDNPLDNRPGCWVAPKFGFQGQLSQYPRTQRDDYSSSSDPSRATTRTSVSPARTIT